MNNIPNNPNIQVETAGNSGLFCNYIYKAIPLAFDESMSYYECLCGLLDYLKNTIIPTVNNNADAVSELQNLYIELKNYVDNYFTNLDVTTEINNKLDEMVTNGTLTNIIGQYVINDINPIIEQQNSQIESINTKVNDIANGSPLVANSISEMTDTNKIYVNTSDGNWYYYNGTNWEIGGVYQATEVADNSITPEKTTFLIKATTNIFKFKTTSQDGITASYNPTTQYTSFNGTSTSAGQRRLFLVRLYIPQGQWCFNSFNYNGNKQSLYGYTDEDYNDQNWSNPAFTFAGSGYAKNFNIETSGYYNIVLFYTNTDTLNYSGQIMLVPGTYQDNPVFIPFKYKLIDEIMLPTNNLNNKKMSILGVSIDTYQGYIPQGQTSYYNPNNLANVDMTWWKKIINKTGIILELNNSWSGACAATEDNLVSSGVQRCTNLGNNPDFIIISAFALNDWSKTSNLTDFDKDLMPIPSSEIDLTDESNYNTYKNTIESYGGAMATIFYRILETYQNSKIFVCDSYNYYRQGNYPFTPTIDLAKINKCNEILYNVAKQFGIEVIKFSECGLTSFNSRSYCVEDLSSNVALHPNDEGHTMLYNKVMEHLSKYLI